MATKKATKTAKKHEPEPAKGAAPNVANGGDKPTVNITDALKAKFQAKQESAGAEVKNLGAAVSKFMQGVHSEAAQAAENDNREFLTTAEIEAHPMMGAKTPEKVIWAAWHETKDAGDPEFDQCVPTHREKFYSHAQAVLSGGSPMVGDTQIARFEQAVSRLNKGE